MADKKPTKREQFENAVYELGLELIDRYRKGAYKVSEPILDAIIEIFKIAKTDDERG